MPAGRRERELLTTLASRNSALVKVSPAPLQVQIIGRRSQLRPLHMRRLERGVKRVAAFACLRFRGETELWSLTQCR